MSGTRQIKVLSQFLGLLTLPIPIPIFRYEYHTDTDTDFLKNTNIPISIIPITLVNKIKNGPTGAVVRASPTFDVARRL